MVVMKTSRSVPRKQILGSLSNYDGDANENVTRKTNFTVLELLFFFFFNCKKTRLQVITNYIRIELHYNN